MRIRIAPCQMGVYAIKSISTGKSYIGSAIDIKERKIRHIGDLKHNRHHCSHLQRAWNKQGKEDFEFHILELCSESLLLKREQAQIDAIWDLGLAYNTARRCERGPGRHTPETRALMSLAQRNRLPDTPETRAKKSKAVRNRSPELISQIALSNTGKKRTDTTKLKMSESQKGRFVSDTTKELLSIASRGKKHSPEILLKISKNTKIALESEEVRERISKALTGIVRSPETRAKMSKAQTGRVVSPETLLKMAECQKGKVMSPEARAKISAAATAQHATRRAAKPPKPPVPVDT